MNTEQKLDLLLRTGAMLLGSGANSTRIEFGISEAVKITGLPPERVHLHLNLRTIMISVEDGERCLTKFRKVKHLGVNMRVINGIQVSLERLVAAQAGPDQLEAELNRVAGLGHMYPEWLILLTVGAATGAFCTVLGGAAPAILFATLGAATGLFVRRRMHHAGMNLYITVLAAATTSCLVAGLNLSLAAPLSEALTAAGLPVAAGTAPSLAVAACVLYLIPGVPLINSVDDLLDGYTLMGIGRATVATLTVLAITWGVVIGLNIWHIPNGDLPHARLPLAVYALCGGIAAAGFAILFNVPRRVLGACVAGGALAVLTRALLVGGQGIEVAATLGALAAGVWGVIWSHRLRVPAAVLAVPAVIPLVPGVFLYKALLGLLNINHVDSTQRAAALASVFEYGLKAGIIVAGLSVGVALPRMLNRYVMKLR